MPNVLEDKVIIVTGSGQGVGRCLAEEAALQGARVVVNDLGKNEEGNSTAMQVAESICDSGGQAIASQHNVADMSAVEHMVKGAIDQWGRVDGLVNNAGILRDKIFHKMSEQEWDQSIEVNLKGCFNTARALAPLFKEQASGSMVHMTSTSGLIGNFGQANYSAGKMGMIGLSKSIALDMNRFNVRSNCVAPFANTPMVMAGVPKETEEDLERWRVIERMKPENIAPLVCALLSDDSTDVTGQIFGARANEVYLFSQPRPIRTMHIGDEGGITTDSVIDRVLPALRTNMIPLDRSMNVFTWDPV